MAGKACWTLMCYIKVYYVELRQASRGNSSCVAVRIWCDKAGRV